MKKDTYYFSHDYNARKDPKCISLIKDFGTGGYGMYWSLIEIMYEQGGKIKKFPSLFSALSHELNISEKTFTKQIEAMLNKYELFVQDEKFIWSESVLLRLQIRVIKNLKRSEAGRIGGLKSGEVRSKTNQNEAIVEANERFEAKEIKGKEIKGNNSDYVECDKSPQTKTFKNFSESDFIEDIKKYESDFSKDVLNNFFSYWKERSPGGKMKFQLEKTWETNLRLETWKRRDQNNSSLSIKKNAINSGSITGNKNSKSATAYELVNQLAKVAGFNG